MIITRRRCKLDLSNLFSFLIWIVLSSRFFLEAASSMPLFFLKVKSIMELNTLFEQTHAQNLRRYDFL